MPEPKIGGYRWRREVNLARTALKKQRKLLERVAEGNLTQETAWQYYMAISLLNSQVDERLQELESFKNGDNDE